MKYLALINYDKTPQSRFTKTLEEAEEYINGKINFTWFDYAPVTTYILEIKKVVTNCEQGGTLVKKDVTKEVIGT